MQNIWYSSKKFALRDMTLYPPLLRYIEVSTQKVVKSANR